MNCSSSASTKNESASQAPSHRGRARSPTIRRATTLSASSSAPDSHAAGEWSERRARSQFGASNQAPSSKKPTTAHSRTGATPRCGGGGAPIKGAEVERSEGMVGVRPAGGASGPQILSQKWPLRAIDVPYKLLKI